MDQGMRSVEVYVRGPGAGREAAVRSLQGAGLREVRVQVGARHAGDPFVVLIASGVKLRTPTPNPKSPIASRRS